MAIAAALGSNPVPNRRFCGRCCPPFPKPQIKAFLGHFSANLRSRGAIAGKEKKKNQQPTDKSGFISRDGKGSGACALGGNAALRGLRHQEFAQISTRFKTGWFHKEMGARVLFVRDITHEGRRERFVLLIDIHFCILLRNKKLPAPSLLFWGW